MISQEILKAHNVSSDIHASIKDLLSLHIREGFIYNDKDLDKLILEIIVRVKHES